MSTSGRTRPSRDTYFLKIAKLASERSTCMCRQVGCILVNNYNHVVATGYNGVPANFPHCTKCVRETPGADLDKCFAVHAEQNALLQAPNIHELWTAYCTDSPCITCVKLMMNTSITRIVYSREYPHPIAKELWLNPKFNKNIQREWIQISLH